MTPFDVVQPGEEEVGGTRRRAAGWLSAGVAVVVAAAAAGAVMVAVRHPGGTEPPALALVGEMGASRPVAAAAGTAVGTTGGRVQVAGPLPASPGRVPVRYLASPAADRAAVVRLATALGLTAAPRQVEGGWTVGAATEAGGSGPGLAVSARDGSFTYARDGGVCPPGRVCAQGSGTASGGAAVSCSSQSACPAGVAADGTAPTTSVTLAPELPVSAAPELPVSAAPAPPVSAAPAPPVSPVPVPPVSPVPVPPARPVPDSDRTLALARRVLAALNLSSPQVTPGLVTAAPRVDGRPVAGRDTTVAVDAEGVTTASGFLDVATTPGPAYPVVDARAALDSWASTAPMPMIAVCPVPATPPAAPPGGSTGPGSAGGCGSLPPIVVTGAALGWLADVDGSRPVLVPAWLYGVRDQTAPLAAVAVEPRYLGTPASVTPAPPKPAGPPAGSAEPGQPAAPPPGQPEPPAPGGAVPEGGAPVVTAPSLGSGVAAPGSATR